MIRKVYKNMIFKTYLLCPIILKSREMPFLYRLYLNMHYNQYHITRTWSSMPLFILLQLLYPIKCHFKTFYSIKFALEISMTFNFSFQRFHSKIVLETLTYSYSLIYIKSCFPFRLYYVASYDAFHKYSRHKAALWF